MRLSLGEPLKDGGSPTMIAQSQPRQIFHLDDHPSESTTYIGSYPDGYPLWSFLKDGGSPIMTVRSQTRQIFHLDDH